VELGKELEKSKIKTTTKYLEAADERKKTYASKEQQQIPNNGK